MILVRSDRITTSQSIELNEIIAGLLSSIRNPQSAIRLLLPASHLRVYRSGAAAVNQQGRRHAEQRQWIFKAAGVYEKTRLPMHAEDRGDHHTGDEERADSRVQPHYHHRPTDQLRNGRRAHP